MTDQASAVSEIMDLVQKHNPDLLYPATIMRGVEEIIDRLLHPWAHADADVAGDLAKFMTDAREVSISDTPDPCDQGMHDLYWNGTHWEGAVKVAVYLCYNCTTQIRETSHV